jgi:hypothetical protein
MFFCRLLSHWVKHNRTLHKLALRLYSLRHPPPWRRANMEFEFDAWNSVSSLHCRGGRQIGEDNAGPYPYGEFTGNRYETCRFHDVRAGLPMNVTSLRLLLPSLRDAYQLTTALRNRYLAKRDLPERRFNLVQAYLFSKFAVSLPAYLARRKDRPVRDGELSPVETAFYMLAPAPFMLVRQLMVRGERTPLEAQPLSAERLYRLASDSRVLVSPRERACPATPKLIREYFDVIMNGAYQGPLDSAEVARSLDRLGDWHRFFDYARAASRIELLVKLSQALTARALLAVDRSGRIAGTEAEPALRAALDAALRASHAKPSAEHDAHAVVETIVDTLAALLRDHGAEAIVQLLDVGGACRRRSAEPDDPVEGAIRIRQITTAIAEAVGREVRTVHRCLGRGDWPAVGEEDLIRRTAGPGLARLLMPSA